MEGKHGKPKVITMILEEGNYKTFSSRKFDLRKPYIPPNEKMITAFIPGTIMDVFTAANKKVKKGEALLILDAMKMENQLYAPFNGIVKKVNVKKGDTVKILAKGEINFPVKVKVAKISQAAKTKIIAAGGSVEEVI